MALRGQTCSRITICFRTVGRRTPAISAVRATGAKARARARVVARLCRPAQAIGTHCVTIRITCPRIATAYAAVCRRRTTVAAVRAAAAELCACASFVAGEVGSAAAVGGRAADVRTARAGVTVSRTTVGWSNGSQQIFGFQVMHLVWVDGRSSVLVPLPQ